MTMALCDRLPLGVTGVMLPELDFDEQIACCQRWGVTRYVFRPRVMEDAQRQEGYSNWGHHKFDLTPQRLVDEGQALGDRLRQVKIEPWCTVPIAHAGLEASVLALHMCGAAQAGCSRIRLNPRPYPAGVFDFDAFSPQVIADYRSVVAQAQGWGLKVVIEMHTGHIGCSPGLARKIVESFDPSQLGVILDLPNMVKEGNLAPELGVSVLGPWLDHCHVGGCRQVRGTLDAQGFRQTDPVMCELSESDLDIPRWLRALAQTHAIIPLVIEDYTPELSGHDRLKRTVEELRRLLPLET